MMISRAIPFLIVLLLVAPKAGADQFDKDTEFTLQTSALPGEGEVRLASARPATRAMYLLYACAIDNFLITHKDALKELSYATRCITDNRNYTIYAFRRYEVAFGRSDEKSPSPDGDAKQIQRDLFSLRRFADSGYKGIYAMELADFIKTLDFIRVMEPPAQAVTLTVLLDAKSLKKSADGKSVSLSFNIKNNTNESVRITDAPQATILIYAVDDGGKALRVFPQGGFIPGTHFELELILHSVGWFDLAPNSTKLLQTDVPLEIFKKRGQKYKASITHGHSGDKFFSDTFTLPFPD